MTKNKKVIITGDLKIVVEKISYDNKTEIRYYDATDDTLIVTMPGQGMSSKEAARILDEARDNHKKSKESNNE